MKWGWTKAPRKNIGNPHPVVNNYEGKKIQMEGNINKHNAHRYVRCVVTYMYIYISFISLLSSSISFYCYKYLQRDVG